VRRAAKVDTNQGDIVRALRHAGCEVLSLAAIGGGVPDLLVYRHATKAIHMIEIKNPAQPPSKRKLTPHQAVFHINWPVHVVKNEIEALAVVGLQQT